MIFHGELLNNHRLYPIAVLKKALMTAAAIGSGAAGGTLTPSVALCATLGAILGVQRVGPGGVGGWEKSMGKNGKNPSEFPRCHD